MDVGPVLEEMTALVDLAATHEGPTMTAIPGLMVHRISHRTTFGKWRTSGPRLNVIARGKKIARVGGETLAYDRSKFLLLSGQTDFVGEIVEADPFLSFCYEIPSEVIAETLLALADSDPPRLDDPSSARIAPMDLGIAECGLRLLRAERDPVERKLVAPLVIRELVIRLLRSDAASVLHSVVRHEEDSAKIGTAIQFIRKNLGRALAVDDIARHVGMSPSHFAHRFRAVARVSPMRYLRTLRLQHARQWMLAEGLRVNETAIRAGYESASHFTRDFKSEFGAAPGEYARRFREAEARIRESGTSSPRGSGVVS